MAEIDDWIKKQLKRGYSKRQIKESMGKAGYDEKAIGSVDFYTDYKKNKQLILYILLILAIILIFIFTIQKVRYRNEKETDTNETKIYNFQKIPSTGEDLALLANYCSKPINENETLLSSLCTLKFDEELQVYEAYYEDIYKIDSLKQGEYISFVIGITKVINERVEKEELESNKLFGVCILSTPVLNNSFYNLSNEKEFIGCMQNITLNNRNLFTTTGFIPDSELFSINIYLVPDDEISKLVSKKDSNEKKSTLKSYPLLYTFEKEIVIQNGEK
jgi:hypothetical protein